ncbi:hypothetical protein Rsub_02993 [Raphidocelis subcapitata]|uniref:Uncharacterized protein n=1 Tax=Raphidocelis subcapitata TaxID=307507 RepID=A0A2V0NYP1_9CHLO|nr:hypothetical protein Rsub_02993 [Raphidocelis subcapitata]|eukprot:GBF90693.1 hypothetical protein Rsub_02993 [Raphidocelis subcapitata]
MESGSILIRGAQDAGGAVHWLPIKTSHSGPCNVEEFFQPREVEECSASGSQALEAHIRGRLLKGCVRKLPEGFSGVVLAPSAPSATASADDREWASTATFGSVTYWNHDTAPAASDWQARAIDWLVLADKVQAPVSLEAVEAELARGDAQP